MPPSTKTVTTIRVLSGTFSPTTTSTKIVFSEPALIGNVKKLPDSDVGPPTPAVRKATTSFVGGEVERSKPTSILDSRAFPMFVTVPLSDTVEPTMA